MLFGGLNVQGCFTHIVNIQLFNGMNLARLMTMYMQLYAKTYRQIYIHILTYNCWDKCNFSSQILWNQNTLQFLGSPSMNYSSGITVTHALVTFWKINLCHLNLLKSSYHVNRDFKILFLISFFVFLFKWPTFILISMLRIHSRPQFFGTNTWLLLLWLQFLCYN